MKNVKLKGLSFEKKMNEPCPICLEDLVSDHSLIRLGCSHTFHRECISGLQAKVCPMCRTEITDLPPDLDSTLNSNVDRRRKFEEIDQRAGISASMIESGQMRIPSWLQYQAAILTLKKDFQVSDEHLPHLTREQVEERFGKTQPFTEAADTIIVETLKTLQRTDDLVKFLQKLG